MGRAKAPIRAAVVGGKWWGGASGAEWGWGGPSRFSQRGFNLAVQPHFAGAGGCCDRGQSSLTGRAVVRGDPVRTQQGRKVVGSASFLFGAFGGRGNELARGALPAQPGCIQVFELPLPQAKTQPGVRQDVVDEGAVCARGRASEGLHRLLLHKPQRVEDDVQGNAEVGASLKFGGPVSPPLPIETESRTAVEPGRSARRRLTDLPGFAGIGVSGVPVSSRGSV